MAKLIRLSSLALLAVLASAAAVAPPDQPPAIVVRWEQSLQIEEQGIHGAARVANVTDNEMQLSLVVVAVNEYGKAFTLGYQHFPLARGRESPPIPLGFRLPRGRYIVHVDAVGEVPTIGRIHRVHSEVGPFDIE